MKTIFDFCTLNHKKKTFFRNKYKLCKKMLSERAIQVLDLESYIGKQNKFILVKFKYLQQQQYQHQQQQHLGTYTSTILKASE